MHTRMHKHTHNFKIKERKETVCLIGGVQRVIPEPVASPSSEHMEKPQFLGHTPGILIRKSLGSGARQSVFLKALRVVLIQISGRRHCLRTTSWQEWYFQPRLMHAEHNLAFDYSNLPFWDQIMASESSTERCRDCRQSIGVIPWVEIFLWISL